MTEEVKEEGAEDQGAAAAGGAPGETTEKDTSGPGVGLLPELDFSTFILSLSSSVLMNLGVVENPVTKQKEKEPAVAKQTIELIKLLKEKTVGNLTEQEGRLLDDVLHELHLWYAKSVE